MSYSKKEVVRMKGIIVFLLSLLVFVSIAGSSNIAFAKDHGSSSAAAVAILDCTVSAPPAITVSAFSITNVTVTIAPSDDCAADLAALLNAGLKVKNVQTLGTTNVVYTLVNGFWD
jgi:hypothetical protein